MVLLWVHWLILWQIYKVPHHHHPPECTNSRRVCFCSNETVLLVSPRSLWGCLSERLNCPAVTTEISISVTPTHTTTRARSLGCLLCACLCLEILRVLFVASERVRVRIDAREIWICGDIDQVERSQGEHSVWERGPAPVGRRRRRRRRRS